MKPKPVIIVLCFNCLVCVSCNINPACECVVYQSDGGSQGTFTSPNFPQIYPPSINCILYTFIGAMNEIVELSFLEFDLQVPILTCKDYVRFYLNLERPEVNEGNHFDEEICGNISMIEKKYYSSSRSLIFEFHTDSIQRNNTGFRGRFKFLNRTEFETNGCKSLWASTCTWDCDSSRYKNEAKIKTFFSPRFPQHYPPNSNCQYRFYAKTNQRIRVKFLNIQLQPIEGSCSSSPDSILVRDGIEASKSNVIANYCNTMNAETITSTSNHLLIEFRSDGQNQRQGFAATFEFINVRHHTVSVPDSSTPTIPRIPTVDPPSGQELPPPKDDPSHSISECGQTISSAVHKNGTITSPKYPHAYPSNTECQISFQGQGKERVQLEFTDLDLFYIGDASDPYDCDSSDVVEVQIHVERADNNLGLYCGSKLPPLLMSNGNNMDVIFSTPSTEEHNHRGFKAKYRFVTDFGIEAGTQDHNMVCGFRFNSSIQKNGTFASPNYPGLYPRNTECHYLFFGQPDEKVHIQFPYFDVEGIPTSCSEDTDSDFIEFSNFNVKLPDRQMPRFCGSKEDMYKKEVESDGSFFRVSFKSNHVYDSTGFEAFFQFRKHIDPLKQRKSRPRSGTASHLTPVTIYPVIMIISVLLLTN